MTNNSNNNVAASLVTETAFLSSWQAALTGGTGANGVTCHELTVISEMRITKLAIEVTTLSAGNFAGVAVYSADGGTLLLESGAIDTTTTGAKTATLGTPVVLLPGNYILAWTATSTVPRFRTMSDDAVSAFANMINSVTVRNATAANASASAVFPATTGTLTATTQPPIGVIFSAE